MRLDDVAPRTLLLGAAAGWALVAWALALAGMGGRVPEPESGAITSQPIPAVPRPAAPTIGPPGQYEAIAARPLFAVDRRPHPFSLRNDAGPQRDAPEFDLVLTSVLITPQRSLAIVQKPDGSEAWRVRVGEAPEAFPAWRLATLAPRSATFVGPEGERTLTLRVFNGQGGPGGPPPGVPAPTGANPMAPDEIRAATPPPAPAPSPATPPATDAAAPDPQQIEAIRRRIEARREQMRQRAQSSNPPATVAPPTPSTR